MVRYLWITVAFIFFFGIEKSFTQTLYDSLRSDMPAVDLFDASRIPNEIFLGTTEDIFREQLQFISDDIERMSLLPLQLSTASWKDLIAVPTLTDLDIYHILIDRKNDSILYTEPLKGSQDFIRSSASVSTHVLIRSKVVLDPEAAEQDVYQNGTYRGSPVKTVSRIIIKNEDVLFSLTQAKAAGEPLYFDHISGCFALRYSLALSDEISLSKFVLGDYSISLGNGLLFSNSYDLFASREVNRNVVPRSGGIKPYISASSFRYFRGAAIEITSGIFSASGFFSDRWIDATIDSNMITSLYNSGYHRSASELARKDQAQSKLTGGRFSMTPIQDEGYVQIGATAYSLNYDKQVVKDSLSLGFSGTHHSLASLDIRTAFSFFSASGEYAFMRSDAGNANAFAASLIAAPLDIWEMSLNYRSLPPAFISPFGGTFGINSADAQNETGWYFGSKVTVIPKSFWLFGAVNISRSENPGNGLVHYSDIRIGSTYNFSSFPLQLIVQLRSYDKGPIFTLTNDSLSKTSIRLDAHSDISRTISMSLRAELQRSISQTENITKSGSLLGIKIRYKPLEELVISSSISFFKSDSYAARFYSNESDLPGSAPFVPLYGSGFRYALQCSYKIINKIEFSARVAETKYSPFAGSPQLHRMSTGIQCDISF